MSVPGLLPLRSLCRWVIFASYLGFVFGLAPAILWGQPGALAGLALTAGFLVVLGWNGTQRTARRLGATPLTRAEAPELHAIATEHARRIGVATPRLAALPSTAVQTAAYGLSRRNATLAFSRGALALEREALSALVARQVTFLYYPDVVLQTWLSRFLSVVESGLGENAPASRRTYSFRVLLRRLLLYPTALVPVACLKSRRNSLRLDLEACRVGRHPMALTETYRKMEVSARREASPVPLCLRHLFLLPPPTEDPLARVFFDDEGLSERVRQIEKQLFKTVPLKEAAAASA